MKKLRQILILFCMCFTNAISAQIVLNELMVRPGGQSSTPPNGLLLNGSREYVELYNNSCDTVNVAGYFIANRQALPGNGFAGGTFKIPDVPASSIPPKKHIVLGPSSASTDPLDIDIVILPPDYCLYTNTFYLPNIDGWLALYNAEGTPIDAVYWTSNAQNLNSQPNDFGGDVLCVPDGSNIPSLLNLQDINSIYPGLVKYGGRNFTETIDGLLSRQIDGTGDWVRNLASSISKSAATGNCNAGICYVNVPQLSSVLKVNLLDTVLQQIELPKTEEVVISLGNACAPIENLQNIVFDVYFDPLAVDTVSLSVDYFESVLGISGVDFINNEDLSDISEGKLRISITRLSNTPLILKGESVVSLSLPILSSAPGGWFKVSVVSISSSDQSGNALTFSDAIDSLRINILNPCDINYWTGAVSTAWENPENWGCGSVPGTNTVVFVEPGKPNYPEVSSMATCKKLNTSPGVSVKVNAGFILDIVGN